MSHLCGDAGALSTQALNMLSAKLHRNIYLVDIAVVLCGCSVYFRSCSKTDVEDGLNRTVEGMTLRCELQYS